MPWSGDKEGTELADDSPPEFPGLPAMSPFIMIWG
jgi:hypothetical protein